MTSTWPQLGGTQPAALAADMVGSHSDIFTAADLPGLRMQDLATRPFQPFPALPIPGLPGLPALEVVNEGDDPYHVNTQHHQRPVLAQFTFQRRKGQIFPGHMLVFAMPFPLRAPEKYRFAAKQNHQVLQPLLLHDFMHLLDADEIKLENSSHFKLGRIPAMPFLRYDNFGREMDFSAPAGNLATFLELGGGWKMRCLRHGPTSEEANNIMYALTRINPLGFQAMGIDTPNIDDLSPTCTPVVCVMGLHALKDIWHIGLNYGSRLYMVLSFQPDCTQDGVYDEHFFCKNRPDLWHSDFDKHRLGLTAQEAIRQSYLHAKPVLTPFAGVHPLQCDLFDTVFRQYPEFPFAILDVGTVVVPDAGHNTEVHHPYPYHPHPKKYLSHGVPMPSNQRSYRRIGALAPKQEDYVCDAPGLPLIQVAMNILKWTVYPGSV